MNREEEIKKEKEYDKYFPCSNPERLLAELDEEEKERGNEKEITRRD